MLLSAPLCALIGLLCFLLAQDVWTIDSFDELWTKMCLQRNNLKAKVVINTSETP